MRSTTGEVGASWRSVWKLRRALLAPSGQGKGNVAAVVGLGELDESPTHELNSGILWRAGGSLLFMVGVLHGMAVGTCDPQYICHLCAIGESALHWIG